MEHSERSSATPSPTSSLSSTPPSSPPRANVIMSPCAACKILRRRCVDKCVLAPYFPPTQPHKFSIAHRVFGASNIIKFLQELPEEQRADAVSSMVYEASARIRDPVYGCAGAICQLQRQVNDLQAQLAKSQAEIVNMKAQHAQLVALICMEMTSSTTAQPKNTVIETAPDQSFDCDDFIGSPLVDDIYSGLGFEDEMGSLGWELPIWPDMMMTS